MEVGWRIGGLWGELPFFFQQPSLLMPWATEDTPGNGYVGVFGNLILSMASVDGTSNQSVSDVTFLHQWTTRTEGLCSDKLGLTVFSHNHDAVPKRLFASLELPSTATQMSVAVGARVVAWKAGEDGAGGPTYFAGVQFGDRENAPDGLQTDRVWPSAYGNAAGVIRIYPICMENRTLDPRLVVSRT